MFFKNRIFLFLILLVFSFGINAQSAQIFSRAGVINNHQDINAMYGNQAGLAYLQNTTITANAVQRFNISELGVYSFAAAVPLDFGSIGLIVDYFGFDEYNEQKIGLAYARPLFDKLSLGVQFDYYNTSITEYGNQAALSFEIGLISKISEQVHIGAHIINPLRNDRVKDLEKLPSSFNLGINYRPSEKLSLSAEVNKDLDYQADLRIGIAYQMVEAIQLNIGAATSPALFSFGVGIQAIENLSIDLATSYHNVLGFSPAGGLSYSF